MQLHKSKNTVYYQRIKPAFTEWHEPDFNRSDDILYLAAHIILQNHRNVLLFQKKNSTFRLLSFSSKDVFRILYFCLISRIIKAENTSFMHLCFCCSVE
mgnify:CR=1 FL=1